MILGRSLPGLGDLELVEVYEFFDEPVLYTCKDATDRYLLAVLAVDDGQRKVWLGAPMSLRRFQQVRSGGMGLREAFRSVEGASLVEVTYSRDADEPSHPAVRWIDAASVGDELLPMAGEALDMATETLPKVVESVSRVAHQTRRDVLRLRLRFPHEHRTEAPAGALGQVLDAIQQVVNAIGQAVLGKATTRGVLPADILEQMQLSVVGTYAGSFGVEFHAHAPDQADFFEVPEITKALEEFLNLLEATENDEAMLARLADLRGRTVSKYRDLMFRLSNQVTSAEVQWGSPRTTETRVAVLYGESARRAAQTLGQATVDATLDFEVRGRLVGYNSRTKTFELWDVIENQKYTGRVDDDALEVVGSATIDDVYSARLRETNERTPDGELKTKYRLLRLGSDHETNKGDDDS